MPGPLTITFTIGFKLGWIRLDQSHDYLYEVVFVNGICGNNIYYYTQTLKMVIST